MKTEDAPSEEKFELLLERLEKAIHTLEDGDVSLDESLKLYTDAVDLYRRCRKLLEDAQRRIEILLKDASGELKPQPFNVDEDQSEPR